MPRSEIREIIRPEIEPILEHQKAGWNTPKITHSDLDFAGADTQYSMHAVHPYVAAINPPLAAELINHYSEKGDALLDPFCGGGGVLLEAVLNGRKATGYDVNPLAAILSKGKTTWVSPEDVLETAKTMVQKLADKAREEHEIDGLIAFWYSPAVAQELKALGVMVDKITHPGLKSVFQVVLSAAARDTMFTYRGEVRLRRLRPADEAKARPDVCKAFTKRANLAAQRLPTIEGKPKVDIQLADCRTIETTKKFDVVVTSPPYGDDKNGVGYFQFSRNMLYFLGINGSQLKDQRKQFLGCGKSKIPAKWNPSPALTKILKACKSISPRLHHDAQQFYFDYFQALERLSQITSKRIIIVTGDRVLARTFIDNGKITSDFMTALGWPLEHYYTREIRKKRIANLGGDGGQISREHVLVHRRA